MNPATAKADAEAIAAMNVPEGWSVWWGQITKLWWAAPPAWMEQPLISAGTTADLAKKIAAVAQDRAFWHP